MDMTTDFDVRRFCSRVEELGAVDPARALWAISRLVLDVISRQSSIGRVFSSRPLDLAAQAIGARLVAGIRVAPKRQDHIVYLFTQVGEFGGHGRVLRDLIAAEPGRKKTLILSHVFPAGSSEYNVISESGVAVEVAPDVDIAHKARWIAERLAAIAPEKSYMMLHQFDAALVAAAQPALTGQLVFLHNCDHSLCLGVHIQHAVHADFHRKGFFRCRSERTRPALQIAPGYIVPLTADDIGTRRGGRFMQRGHVTTCTTGGVEKSVNAHYLEPRPYLYQYSGLVASTLAASRGTHIHVGPLPDEMIAQIRADVASLSLPENRFVHIRNAPSVWQLFLDEAVDVYIGSVPYGGGRATVEAMGAGLPLLIHSNYRSEFLCVECEVYRDAMIWRNFDQFRDHIGRLTPIVLERQSALSRAYYEGFHAPRQLREALARIDRGLPQPEPEPLAWRGDALQDFIDDVLPGMQRSKTGETAALLALGGRSEADFQKLCMDSALGRRNDDEKSDPQAESDCAFGVDTAS
jgi:hypothetical protein